MSASRSRPDKPFEGLPRPLLFAHRGASRMAPENTHDAFDLAVRLGAQVLEMDVHRCADGEVVVLHDATLERTSNGVGPVASKTYAELCKLDAGCKFFTPSGSQPFVGSDVVIPRLADIVAAFPHCGFNIEIKQAHPDLIPAVLKIVAKLPPERLVLAAENDNIMRALEDAAPACSLGLSRAQVMRVFRYTAFGRCPVGYSGRALQIPPRHLGVPLARPSQVRLAQQAKLDVHLWVINHAQDAEKYLARGIDGMMTDDLGEVGPVVDNLRARNTELRPYAKHR